MRRSVPPLESIGGRGFVAKSTSNWTVLGTVFCVGAASTFGAGRIGTMCFPLLSGDLISLAVDVELSRIGLEIKGRGCEPGLRGGKAGGELESSFAASSPPMVFVRFNFVFSFFGDGLSTLLRLRPTVFGPFGGAGAARTGDLDGDVGGDLCRSAGGEETGDLLTFGWTKATFGPCGDLEPGEELLCGSGRIVKPLNLPNIVLLFVKAPTTSSLLEGRSNEAFMSSGFVGNDLPFGLLVRVVLPDIGDEAFDGEPSLIIGLVLEWRKNGGMGVMSMLLKVKKVVYFI